MKSPDADEPDSDVNKRRSESEPTRANYDLPSTVGGGLPSDTANEAIGPQLAILLDPPTKPGTLGKILDYEVQSLEGRGAMGFVFRAFDPKLHRIVAIKVMVAELSATPGARERFVREAQSAASINHSNVVTVHAVGEHRGLPFLVMEYVQGQTLQKLIQDRGTLSIEDTLRIAHQIAAGLCAAHQHGIVHRDVKPGNILIENGVQRVKIADFGLARVALESSGLTSHGQTVGTPGYMAPEQVEGLTVDCRADLFSLGCVIYAMLTGHTPFRAGNTLAVLQAVAKLPHVPLSEIAPATPPVLAQLVERLLKKDPNVRLGTAAEALQELDELTRSIGTPSRMVAAQRQAEEVAVAREASRSRWRKVGGTSAAVLLLVIIAAVRFLPNGSQNGGNLPTPNSPTTTASIVPGENAPVTAPNQSPAMAPSAPVTLPTHVVVGDQSNADFRTVREALARQPAPTHIRLVTKADHTEAIVISGSRHAGLELVWDGPGALRAPNDKPVVQITNAEKVTLRGFRIAAESRQHGLRVEGRCPALTIVDCSITQPDGASSAAVHFFKPTGASAEAPMTLMRARIFGSDLPIRLLGDEANPVAHWHVEDCLIVGVSNNTGTAIVIEGPAANLRFQRNRLARYKVGFSIGRILDSFELSSNTLFDMEHVFATSEGLDLQTRFDISDNLLARASLGEIDPHLRGINVDSFRDNLRDSNKPIAWPGVRDISEVRFASEDVTSPDFLRPADPAAVLLTPTDVRPPRYAGALLPVGVAESKD